MIESGVPWGSPDPCVQDSRHQSLLNSPRRQCIQTLVCHPFPAEMSSTWHRIIRSFLPRSSLVAECATVQDARLPQVGPERATLMLIVEVPRELGRLNWRTHRSRTAACIIVTCTRAMGEGLLLRPKGGGEGGFPSYTY